MKRVAIIAYDEIGSQIYAKQINELFIGLVSADAYHTSSGKLAKKPVADLFMVSTDAFDSNSTLASHVSLDAEYVEIGVTFTNKAIAKISEIPAGTTALFVNYSERMCNESISRLYQLGINHIDLIPYYPGVEYTGNYAIAITPGESRFVPERIKRMIDVGSRLLDCNTIIEIALKLGLDHILEQTRVKTYFASMADNTYGFDRMYERSIRTERRFDILLNILNDGIIGADENGLIFAYNSTAGDITGIKRQRAIGSNVYQLFDYMPFAKCHKSGRKVDPVIVKHKNMALNVSIDPVTYNGINMGMFATIQRFSDQESKQNMLRGQLRENTQHAKYTFADITGESRILQRARSVAEKMARTNSSVLITGESGTGKELFAHAIHNASPRSVCPFVAINCAALPDNLLESELFGYEDGSFTGARKGGKLGLFEFAHTGSIFLDEVEGMSASLQVKLLRVIQEKEIMHIGGKGVIHIDVRVIATSNERLDELVSQNRFRSDLYYRLNTLPIYLPPLRERPQDIPLLVDEFKQKLGGSFTIDSSVWGIFYSYPWKGNIRELRNCIEYFTFLEKDVICPEDLPPSFMQEKNTKLSSALLGTSAINALKGVPLEKSEDYIFILEQLMDAKKRGHTIGREEILVRARAKNMMLSQQDIRQMLAQLQELGLIKIFRGRGGSKLTNEGMHVAHTIINGY